MLWHYIQRQLIFFFSILPLSYSVCYSLNLITLRVSRVIKRHVDYFLFPHHDSRENSEIALSRFLVIGSLQRGALAQSKEKASDFVQDRVRIKDLYFFFSSFLPPVEASGYFYVVLVERNVPFIRLILVL